MSRPMFLPDACVSKPPLADVDLRLPDLRHPALLIFSGTFRIGGISDGWDHDILGKQKIRSCGAKITFAQEISNATWSSQLSPPKTAKDGITDIF